MTGVLQRAADHVLSRMVSSSPRVPGVVAMVTDRSGNIYKSEAGKRMLGQVADMTTDCVFAIFSTTKAITGRLMQVSRKTSSTSMLRRRTMRPTSASFRCSMDSMLQASRSCARRSAISRPAC